MESIRIKEHVDKPLWRYISIGMAVLTVIALFIPWMSFDWDAVGSLDMTVFEQFEASSYDEYLGIFGVAMSFLCFDKGPSFVAFKSALEGNGLAKQNLFLLFKILVVLSIVVCIVALVIAVRLFVGHKKYSSIQACRYSFIFSAITMVTLSIVLSICVSNVNEFAGASLAKVGVGPFIATVLVIAACVVFFGPMYFKGMEKKKGVGQYILLVLLLAYTIFCMVPVLVAFVAAFTDEIYITQNGFKLFPEQWSLNGMNAVLKYGKQLAQSYGITIFITVVGTFAGLLIMSMYAYSISRPGFKLAGFLSVFLLIPMLFNGGQLSGYIVFTSVYGLKDNILLLILPLCISTMNVIILRTYIVNSIPMELMEAAKIDGAGEYRTFFQITLPLMKPSLAAVGFMMATAYWNDWQNAMLYIDTNAKKPLQILLVNIQKSIEFLLSNANVPASVRAAMGGTIPQYSSTMATVLVVIGPIMIAYPFFQKYFVKGLTVGSVKG